MASSSRTLQVNIVGDTSNAQRSISSLSSKAKKETGAMRKSFSSIFSGITSTGVFGPFTGALSALQQHSEESFSSVEKDVDKAKGGVSKFGTALSGLGKFTLGAGALGFAIVGTESVKMAASFQSAAEHLVTDAGESQSALGMVENGMLAVSSATGTASADIVNGMYHIESAGYHGAAGLQILKAAAEGAKVGGADLDTVSKTLTGTMRAYNIPASQAVQTMNELIATVGSGDMRMQDLASSLGNVAPIAAAAHVSLAQVGGAIATMTAQNMSADQATQDLANTIRALQNPNNVAVNEMQQLGINSNEVAQQLGKRGLTGTIQYLTATVLSQMGPSGEVLLKTFNQSQAAAGDLKTMLAAMTPAVRSVANEFMAGKLTMSQFRKALPANEMGVATQFQTLYNKVHGFNDALKAGTPAAQTYNAAMAKIMGGATGLNTALMLSGGNASEFERNVDNIALAAKKGGKNVANWGAIQKTFNQQLDVAKTTAENLGIKLGMVLIPKIEDVMHDTEAVVIWFEKHKAAAEALGIVIGGVLTAAVVAYTISMVTAAAATIAAAAPVLAIIAACAALGVGIYELATHWHQVWGEIKQWAADAWHGIDGDFVQPIEHFFESIASFISAHWGLILGIITGPIGLALYFIVTNFNNVVNFLKGIPSDLTQAFLDVGKAIANGFIWGINNVISAWDWLVGNLNIPGFSIGPVHFGGLDLGSGLQIGQIPYLAQGGIITGPMLAMLGDNMSGTEAVVPLEQASRYGFGDPDASRVPVTIEVPLYIDGRQFARATARYTRDELLRGAARDSKKVGLS